MLVTLLRGGEEISLSSREEIASKAIAAGKAATRQRWVRGVVASRHDREPTPSISKHRPGSRDQKNAGFAILLLHVPFRQLAERELTSPPGEETADERTARAQRWVHVAQSKAEIHAKEASPLHADPPAGGDGGRGE
jgi:hypothetical protein